MNSIKTLLLASALFAFVLSLSACNTVKGVGKDLQESSENVQKKFSESGSSETQPK